jgi:hypothetical protein
MNNKKMIDFNLKRFYKFETLIDKMKNLGKTEI